MNNKEKLQRYEELKLQIASLEEEANKLKPEVIALIPEGKNIETEYGVFSVQQRATWKFSRNHEILSKNIKELEADEKAKGIATATYTPVLYYKAKSNETDQ